MNQRRARLTDIAGFTLVETLIAIALMGIILAALGTVTAQWLPNWSRGFARAQQSELLSLGLTRIASDVAAAEFIQPNRGEKRPLFEGDELSVMFVRSAIGPNTMPGLEMVRIAETADARGWVTVRTRGPFVPSVLDARNGPRLSDPVVLIRGPYRLFFSYAGPDRVWRGRWHDEAELPSAMRVLLRDAASERTLSASTSTMIHVDVSPDCVRAKDPRTCDTTNSPGAGSANGAPPGIETSP